MPVRKQGAGERPLPEPEVGSASVGNGQRTQVALLQGKLNGHLHGLGAPTLLAIDGRWGPQTDLAFKRVCRILGIEPERSDRTVRIIAGDERRSAAESERAALDGARFAARLREVFAHAEAPAAVAVEEDELLEPDDLIDPDLEDAFEVEEDDEFEDEETEVPVLVRFDPEIWQALEQLAAAEKTSVGAMLATAIQRAAYLQRVTAEGGQLLVKRKGRVYRLREARGGRR